MDRETEPINPRLTDLFRTALQSAQPAEETPRIVVNGSHNVISWGGTVYMQDASLEDARKD